MKLSLPLVASDAGPDVGTTSEVAALQTQLRLRGDLSLEGSVTTVTVPGRSEAVELLLKATTVFQRSWKQVAERVWNSSERTSHPHRRRQKSQISSSSMYGAKRPSPFTSAMAM